MAKVTFVKKLGKNGVTSDVINFSEKGFLPD
jgi:hypothetical protein